MRHNPAFQRALTAFAHPAIIGAVLLLLLNDHVLRHEWPSWWTGKLGDAVWLAFAPILTAFFLALAIPTRLKNQEQIVAALAFGLTAAVFVSAKTIPFVHTLLVEALQVALGTSIGLRLDPTDLLTLPALVIGWQVWWLAKAPPQLVTRQTIVIAALAAVATIANMPAFPEGISCLIENPDGTVSGVHHTGGPTFRTADGGLTWEQVEQIDWEDPILEQECINSDRARNWHITHPTDNQVAFRFFSGSHIERSNDNGQSWVTEIDVTHTEAEIVYYENTKGLFYFEEGPLDATFDEQTGNLIVAMGVEGVLVRSPDGAWSRIPVGGYQPAALTHVGAIRSLLFVEGFMAVGLFFLSAILLFTLTGQPGALEVFLAILATGAWLLPLIISPALSFPNFGFGLFMFYIFPFTLVIPLIGGIMAMYQMNRAIGRLPREVWLTLLTSSVFFILPYVLWTQAIIPYYWIARLVAVGLVIGTLVVGSRAVKKRALIERM